MTQLRVNKEKLDIFFFSSHAKKSRERLLSAICIVKYSLRLVGWLMVVTRPIRFPVHALEREREASLCSSIFLRAGMLISQKPSITLSLCITGMEWLRHTHF